MGYNVREAVKAIKENRLKDALELLETSKVIFDEWGVEDVENQYADNIARGYTYKLELTPKLAEEVLEHCMDTFDANIGINWDAIDASLDYVLNAE